MANMTLKDWEKANDNTPLRVVFYGRVSTEHEAQVHALENQLQWYRDIASRNSNWTVVAPVETYLDKGITGTQAKKRPGFMQMITDAKLGKFDMAVTREVSRFGRNTLEALQYSRELKSAGVQVYFVNDNIRTIKDDDAELKLGLMASFAQEESRKTSSRVKAGQYSSRQKGVLYGTGNILGFNRVKRKGDKSSDSTPTFTVDEEQAETVRMIYRLYLSGLGLKKIKNELEKECRKTATGLMSWDVSTISRVLDNPMYMGKQYQCQTTVEEFLSHERKKNSKEDFILIDGDFAPIIDEDTFNKVKALRQKKGAANPFKGEKGATFTNDKWSSKLECDCGSTFKRFQWNPKADGTIPIGYSCRKKVNDGSLAFRQKNGMDIADACDSKSIPEWHLELAGKTVFSSLITDKRAAVLENYAIIERCYCESRKNAASDSADAMKVISKNGQLVPEEEPELLSNIIRIFKDIPENCTVDIFGEIYEYFLGNFALAEGKDGGTFYTPATVVRYMVQVLDPQPGEKKFLDPACGSGGMFVQAARYMHQHNASETEQMQFKCFGVEKEPDTVKLAKMNLLLNNVRGDITEANSFYSDPYNAFGNFDYVMANPPFNVDEVTLEKVVDDKRFSTYGVPRNKSTSAKKKSDKKETVPNANYLWIGYFATALNEHGKAALVMANSASDASGSEYEIRKKMVDAGIISQMVTLPSNMFSSVTLPATLWFFDRDKAEDKKREILFIDARNVFTQVDRAHRKFSDEQIKNLGIITRLYHGDTQSFADLLDEYRAELAKAPETAEDKETKTKGYWQQQIDWLLERFPEGKYRDVIGLCKAASMDGEDGIIDQDYSLNAGRYVGVVIEDDGMTEAEFKDTMLGLNTELSSLNAEAKGLEDKIAANIKALFGE